MDTAPAEPSAGCLLRLLRLNTFTLKSKPAALNNMHLLETRLFLWGEVYLLVVTVPTAEAVGFN